MGAAMPDATSSESRRVAWVQPHMRVGRSTGPLRRPVSGGTAETNASVSDMPRGGALLFRPGGVRYRRSGPAARPPGEQSAFPCAASPAGAMGRVVGVVLGCRSAVFLRAPGSGRGGLRLARQPREKLGDIYNIR